MNLYNYCGGNPVIFVDPSGRWQEGDENLSQVAQDIIIAAGEQWLEAYQNGNQADMEAAHAKAEAARASCGAYSVGEVTITTNSYFGDQDGSGSVVGALDAINQAWNTVGKDALINSAKIIFPIEDFKTMGDACEELYQWGNSNPFNSPFEAGYDPTKTPCYFGY